MKCEGDLHFGVTCHNDRVIIIHDRADQHQIKYKAPMQIEEFITYMKIMISPDYNSTERKVIIQTVFNITDLSNFGNVPIKIVNIYHGNIIRYFSPEVEKFARIYFTTIANVLESEFQNALEHLKSQFDDENDEENIELCLFCKQRGKISCLHCLSKKGSKRIVKLFKNANIHGFGN